MTKNYHVYAFEWAQTSVTWYIDGVQTCRVTSSSIPTKPMYLIINTAITSGGASGLPVTTHVDYVKVTQP